MSKSARRKPIRKRPTNLTLDAEALARGERFSKRHGTSVSQLVTGFLYSLPAEGDALPQLTPPVGRLYGLAAGGITDQDEYRRHLAAKYAGR